MDMTAPLPGTPPAPTGRLAPAPSGERTPEGGGFNAVHGTGRAREGDRGNASEARGRDRPGTRHPGDDSASGPTDAKATPGSRPKEGRGEDAGDSPAPQVAPVRADDALRSTHGAAAGGGRDPVAPALRGGADGPTSVREARPLRGTGAGALPGEPPAAPARRTRPGSVSAAGAAKSPLRSGSPSLRTVGEVVPQLAAKNGAFHISTDAGTPGAQGGAAGGTHANPAEAASEARTLGPGSGRAVTGEAKARGTTPAPAAGPAVAQETVRETPATPDRAIGRPAHPGEPPRPEGGPAAADARATETRSSRAPADALRPADLVRTDSGTGDDGRARAVRVSAASAYTVYAESGAALASTAPSAPTTASGNAPLPAPSQAPGGELARAVVPQIAAAIGVDAASGRIELRLDPPELGRVEIAIEIVEQSLRATLSAERPGTHDLLRRHGEMLLAQLQEAGFSGVDLRFAGERGRNGHGAFGSPDGPAAPDVPDEAAAPAALGTRAPGRPAHMAAGLDLRF